MLKKCAKSKVIRFIGFLFLSLVSCSDDEYVLSSEAIDEIIVPEDEYVVILGDIQEYTNDDFSIIPLRMSMEWIIGQHKVYNNFSSILQVGDVTNTNKPHQWQRYDKIVRGVMKYGLPVFSCTGNHDYDWSKDMKIYDRNSTYLTNILGHCFEENLIVSKFENDKVDNIIVRLPNLSTDLYLVILEFGPRPEAVAWAAEWVESHPDNKFILMTHEILTVDGEIIDGINHSEYQFSDTANSWTNPMYIVEQLLVPYPNIVLTLCGHNGFAEFNESRINILGKKIPIILFNLQYQDNGGDSMILLMRISKESPNKINLIVYKTSERTIINTLLTGRTIEI